MKTYTSEQAADILQVIPNTIRRLARKGLLQGSQIGRNWRFTEHDIEQFLKQQRPTRQPETAR